MKYKLYNYEIVKNTMELKQDRFLRITEISQLSGLGYNQVSRIIHAAWKLGWVSRKEEYKHNNCFGEGKIPVIRTMYKIKRVDSWAGLMPLYKQVMKNEKSR